MKFSYLVKHVEILNQKWNKNEKDISNMNKKGEKWD